MKANHWNVIPTLCILQGTENSKIVKRATELLEKSGLPFKIQVISYTIAAYAGLDRGYDWEYPCLYYEGMEAAGLKAIERRVKENVHFVKGA